MATYLLAHTSAASPDYHPETVLSPLSPSPKPTAGTLPDSSSANTGHSDAIWCTKWAKLSDGESIVVTAGADHEIRTWNPSSGARPTTVMKPEACLGIVGLDLDKDPAQNGISTYLIANSLDSVLTRWSLDGEQQARKEMGSAESWGVSIHPSAPNVATAGAQGKVRIMSAAIEDFGKELVTMDAQGTFGMAVQYSPDGRFLAVGSETGYVTLFDAQTGQFLSSLPAHASPIRSISFTTHLLITASDDHRLNLFDLQSLSSSASSSSANRFYSRKGQVASLGGHEGWVTCCSPRNDRLLASGSSDGTIKLWDLANLGSATGAISTLRDHQGDVWSLDWMPEEMKHAIEGLGGSGAGLSGGQLVSGGEDAALRWWRGGG